MSQNRCLFSFSAGSEAEVQVVVRNLPEMLNEVCFLWICMRYEKSEVPNFFRMAYAIFSVQWAKSGECIIENRRRRIKRLARK